MDLSGHGRETIVSVSALLDSEGGRAIRLPPPVALEPAPDADVKWPSGEVNSAKASAAVTEDSRFYKASQPPSAVVSGPVKAEAPPSVSTSQFRPTQVRPAAASTAAAARSAVTVEPPTVALPNGRPGKVQAAPGVFLSQQPPVIVMPPTVSAALPRPSKLQPRPTVTVTLSQQPRPGRADLPVVTLVPSPAVAAVSRDPPAPEPYRVTLAPRPVSQKIIGLDDSDDEDGRVVGKASGTLGPQRTYAAGRGRGYHRK